MKDLLVHMDDSKSAPGRAALAAQLAARHNAHLAGLYVKPSPYVPAYVAGPAGAEVVEMQRRLAEEGAEEAKKIFEKACKAEGTSPDWRVDEGLIEDVVALHARYADMAVVGQHDPDTGMGPDVAGQVALGSGRPVLVVPYAGKFDKVGEHVLVAWNASAEAARAVNDALPLIAAADKVTVLSINPKSTRGHGEVPGADITLHLARHGIKAEATSTNADDIDVGNLLLSRASDLGADMIVMGAYGHSRTREMLFGGASRHILHHMTVPVLMSH